MTSSSPKTVDPKLIEQVTDEMKAEIAEKALNGKVTCAVLRKYAEDTEITYAVAGAAADLAGVRVHDCGLGCF